MSDDHLGMADKRAVLHKYLTESGLTVMVETGIYDGDGSGITLAPLLTRLIACDIVEDNINRYRERAAEQRLVAEMWHGSSAELMPAILTTIKEPAFFWLDAHEWKGEWGDNPNPSPLLHELEAITRWPHAAASTVAIDDIRLMEGSELAEPGWPSMEEIRNLAGDRWAWSEADDIIRLTPR